MGSLFRSEDMSLCQLYLQTESAYAAVSKLGELGIVEFKDLNFEVNAFQRKFVGEVRRCEEMERQLRFFDKELKKDEIQPAELHIYPEAPDPRDMIDLEATYERMEGELKEMNSSLEALKRNHQDLQELRHVLRHIDNFFIETESLYLTTESPPVPSQAPTDVELEAVTPSGEPTLVRRHLGYFTGVMPREKINGFMRLLWFACRGNVFVRYTDIYEPLIDAVTGEQVSKVVFMVFFQGEQLKARVQKICEGYKATLYPVPESPQERAEMFTGIMSRMQDLEMVLNKSSEQRLRVLNTISQNLRAWFIKALKIKAIYHTMNMFHTEGKNYVAECWLPSNEIGTVQMILSIDSESSGIAPSLLHPIKSNDMLPTYNKTNKFTTAFQSIINAYSVASYKEVNPAPFSIITFPFLFSVMFGDIGHGTIMFLFGLWMVVKERSLLSAAKNSEMFNMIYSGRYLVMMMGLFSIYAGFLYNDCFSKSFNIFGSSWQSIYDNETIEANSDLTFDANSSAFKGQPYPFGIDPVWQMATNKISFTNSFKEKISVIFGVSQMLLGILLGFCNHIHFRQALNVFCDFLPMILFLLSIFGYMCALIIAKWLMFDAASSGDAPSILIGFINMFLMTYPETPKYQATWYPFQKYIQIGLVILALFSAMWMLFSKPLILYFKHRKVRVVRVPTSDGPGYNTLDNERDHIIPNEATINVDGVEIGENNTNTTVSKKEEEFVFGEVFINQCIHTIEFCLGCVSHTASYLRLWALSLAHGQLSEVLWSMVMNKGLTLQLPGPFFISSLCIVVVFVPFACLTLAILLLMEGLSAFLHTLRLHWVEFNSKFYKGEGVLFHPFTFKDVTEEASQI